MKRQKCHPIQHETQPKRSFKFAIVFFLLQRITTNSFHSMCLNFNKYEAVIHFKLSHEPETPLYIILRVGFYKVLIW